MLAEGPSNGSMMAQQTTLFGTVVEKGQFFKACLVLTTALGTMQLLKRVDIGLRSKQGLGVGLGEIEKLVD